MFILCDGGWGPICSTFVVGRSCGERCIVPGAVLRAGFGSWVWIGGGGWEWERTCFVSDEGAVRVLQARGSSFTTAS